ncbi:hypothetical protein QR680_005851 [Steinernema hermaphroditum]|uniref:Uncharacterized protein n=1 Tax=Steinernema hermaphroditum TaxID=289476 RepID=A0AA39HVP7_9BILA|nr:hypothetical protein QR680_005851 [Steinernema hermaphroditum]
MLMEFVMDHEDWTGISTLTPGFEEPPSPTQYSCLSITSFSTFPRPEPFSESATKHSVDSTFSVERGRFE